MVLSEKLKILFKKFIDKSSKREDFSSGREHFSVNVSEIDGKSYTIKIKLNEDSIDNMNSNEKRYVILFKDLSADVSFEDFSELKKYMQDKLRKIEEIEREKELKKQERLVDDLINKIK